MTGNPALPDPWIDSVDRSRRSGLAYSGWAGCAVRGRVHALRISAKGAVDDDLVQSVLEEGELLIIELADEQLRDPADMDGRRLSQAGDARLGEGNDHATAV